MKNSNNKFTQPVTKEYIEEFYKYGKFAWTYQTINGYFELPSIYKLERIVNIIRKIRPHLILDLGCGAGLFLKELSNEFNIIGVDIDYKLLIEVRGKGQGTRDKGQGTRGKGNYELNLICGDCNKLLFKDNVFDCVLCSELLEHIPDYTTTLLEIKRVLKNNKYAIFTFPNMYCYDSIDGNTKLVTTTIKLINLIRKLFKKQPIYEFGYNTHINKKFPYQWKRILKNYEFEIIENQPIFISPYIPKSFELLKRIEQKIYGNSFIRNLQKYFEEKLGRFFPFSICGQLHLFVCKNRK